MICLGNFYSGLKDKIMELLGNPYSELVRRDITFPYYVEVSTISLARRVRFTISSTRRRQLKQASTGLSTW